MGLLEWTVWQVLCKTCRVWGPITLREVGNVIAAEQRHFFSVAAAFHIQ